MKKIANIVLALLIASGCNSEQQPEAQVDLASEREAAETVIREYFDGYEAEEWNQVQRALTTSNDFLFFGTDSTEVSTSVSSFHELLSKDWQVLDNIQIGEFRNLSALIDEDAQLASLMYEATFSGVPTGGNRFEVLVRFAHTLRKEDGRWRLVQGMATIPTTGNSSSE